MDDASTADRLNRALSKLDLFSTLMLKENFGLNGSDAHTPEQISRIYDIPEEEVENKIEQALRLLRFAGRLPENK